TKNAVANDIGSCSFTSSWLHFHLTGIGQFETVKVQKNQIIERLVYVKKQTLANLSQAVFLVPVDLPPKRSIAYNPASVPPLLASNGRFASLDTLLRISFSVSTVAILSA
ncbi:MAG TPA: hypothetical protein VLS45_00475, partial [Methylomicrobium sp.]|nr:hypothetical protein [Methylomicrobium sp.]